MAIGAYEEITPELYRRIARSSHVFPTLDQLMAIENNWWFFGGMEPIAFKKPEGELHIYLEDITSPYYDYLICKMSDYGSFDIVNLEEDIDYDDTE